MEDIFVACLPVTQLCENLKIADVKEAEQEVECIDDDLSLDEATSRFINNELKWRNAANEKAKENSYTYQIRFYRPNQMKTTALKVWGKFTLALKMISQYALCFLEQLKLVARRNFSLKFSLVLLAFIGLLFTPKLNYNVEISLPQFTLPNLPDFAPPKYTTSKLTSKNEIEELKRYTQYLESRLEKLTNFTIEQQESLLRSIEALQSRDCTYAIKPDKTGLADYALESSGGEIVPEWTSRGLMTSYPLLKIWEIPLFYKTLSPRLAIQPQVNPGNCFGYNGMEGSIGIKLSRDIVVSAISIEHIPKEVAPNGDITSAPRNITVYGNSINNVFHHIGTFEYNSSGTPVQTFTVSNTHRFGQVKVDINSNWGNKEYTCVYRIRVHGN